MSQRRWMRFPSDVSSVSLLPSGSSQLTADVVDESFTGIAVDLDDADGLIPNQQVDLDFRGEQRRGIVRYVVPMANGRYRVGLEWLATRHDSSLLHA